VSAKLEQLLAYLDRDGVTEINLGLGRPLTIRSGDTYKSLTVQPLTRPQLESLLRGTPLEHFLERAIAASPQDFGVGHRRVRVEVVQRGTDTMMRIETAKPTARSPGSHAFDGAPAARINAGAPRVDAATAAGSVALESEQVAAPGPTSPAASPAASDDDAILEERADMSVIGPLVRAARQRGASDLHVSAGQHVLVRVLGNLVPVDRGSGPASGPLTVSEAEALLLPLLGPVRRRRLESAGYVDLSLDVQGAGRLRGNVSRQRSGLHGAFRLAASRPQTLDELGLPKDLAKVVSHHQGLVVIAGPSGHGKTTTMAALVDLVNSSRPHHIITIEDPVEIIHPRKAAVISQREVGSHTRSFVAALKASLREDPDVIVIGELRDRETVEIALTAAETGHLVLATMSTPSAAKTIDRLIDMFPPDQQSQVRASIGSALRAIIAQRLLPATAGDGMVAAVELVTGVLPLAVLIRDDKLHQLPSLMQRGRAYGMIRLDESLLELVRIGRITEDTMRQNADRKDIAVPTAQVAAGAAPAAVAPAAPARRGLFGRKDKE
jgi:twitching motility protein PilT